MDEPNVWQLLQFCYLFSFSLQRRPAYLEYMTTAAMLLGGQNATTRQKMNGILEFEEQLARVPCGHVTLSLATCHHFSFSSFPQFMFLILKSLDSLVNYCHNAILCRRIHDSPFHCLLFFFFNFQSIPSKTLLYEHEHDTITIQDLQNHAPKVKHH